MELNGCSDGLSVEADESLQAGCAVLCAIVGLDGGGVADATVRPDLLYDDTR